MANHLKQHQDILSLAATQQLPDQISDKSEIPIEVARELVEAGYLQATATQGLRGRALMQPRITISGREYLALLDMRAAERSLKGRIKKFGLLFIGWLAGLMSALGAAWLGKFL